MKKSLPLIMLFFLLSNIGFSQYKFLVQNKKRSTKINFKLLNNLIIVPVEINGVELSFILDTGVSKPIVFNFLNLSDTLKIKDTEKITLRGLGEGDPVEALKSRNNVFKIGAAINLNQDLYAIQGLNLNFGPRLGIPVYGIVGYDVFKDLVVEINYASKYIRLTEPHRFKYKNCKNCELLNLEFYNNKPYVNVEVNIDNRRIPVKLLIDSGGSDSLWLFEDDTLGIVANDKHFNDFLGHGLSGSVYGKRSRIESLSLQSFIIKRPNVAFPDSTSILLARNIKNRNGSLAGNILKRFNIIIDYRNAIMILKKNKNFAEKFSYNKSGIELAHNGVRIIKEIDNSNYNDNNFVDSEEGTTIIIDPKYKLSLKPAYEIVELRAESPAHKAGLMKGDVLLSINRKSSYQYSLQQLTTLFYEDAGKRIELKVDRRGHVLKFVFYLEELF